MEPTFTGPAGAPTPPLRQAQGERQPTRTASRWWRRAPWTPPRIVAVYAVVGLLWIVFSDRALAVLVPDLPMRQQLQTAKGILFVVLTSVLLLELIRRGERSLAALGAEVRGTVDSMLDGVLLVDGRMRIVEVNRAALELLGAATKDEVLGDLATFGQRFSLRFLDGAPVQMENFATVRALQGERVQAYEAILRRIDGQDVYVSVSAAPVDAESGRLAVAVMRDVSPARRLDEARDEFLATAAHEFKTPLAVIKAYAQVVQKRTPGEGPALTVVQRQVERLNRMVEHLLDASRLRLDPMTETRHRFDLSALAAEVVGRVRSTAPSHELDLSAPAPAPVWADRQRISRVLAALLDNAIRFSPLGGPVLTTVDRGAGEVVVAVQDRGLGIPAEKQERVFERYYRAHAGTPEDYGGLGLSLNLCRDIVARHGGRMWLESTAGRGSTFRFSLPLAPEEAA